MLHYFKLNPQLDWQGVMEEACSTWRTKNLLAVICRLILSSVVYNLWQTRNEFRFQCDDLFFFFFFFFIQT
jgi:hypothetical protein